MISVAIGLIMALGAFNAFKYAWTWSKGDYRLLLSVLRTVLLYGGTPPADPAENADEKENKATKVS